MTEIQVGKYTHGSLFPLACESSKQLGHVLHTFRCSSRALLCTYANSTGAGALSLSRRASDANVWYERWNYFQYSSCFRWRIRYRRYKGEASWKRADVAFLIWALSEMRCWIWTLWKIISDSIFRCLSEGIYHFSILFH